MTETDTSVLADRTLNGAVARVRDDQWDMEMPAPHDIARAIGVDPALPAPLAAAPVG